MFKDKRPHRNVPGPVKGLFILMMISVVIFVLGQVIMFLWNTILVEVTGVKVINFWQAIGLFALSRILFGSFHFNKGRQMKRKMRKGAKWREKWMNMSEEERAEFKQRWKDRCGRPPRTQI
ncbi:MAG: hypothetical protein KTR30_15675 [Saprospiraceae bacterium]|nr:hypothetical protein [Saprospiraceae bacterium]